MWKYGQYCPLAHAVEILGDRWTLLIIRDLMLNTHHFNDLEHGLPGISRALLSKRLQHLQDKGIIEKRFNSTGRQTTEYHLTEAGWDLQEVVFALLTWGTKWAFDEPAPEELNPVLLMWWIHRNIHQDRLPDERVVVQIDFDGAETMSFWLVLTQQDVTLCVSDPGFGLDLLITADLATFYKVWVGRISYYDALASRKIQVEGIPSLARAFPHWIAWSNSTRAIHSTPVEPTTELVK